MKRVSIIIGKCVSCNNLGITCLIQRLEHMSFKQSTYLYITNDVSLLSFLVLSFFLLFFFMFVLLSCAYMYEIKALNSIQFKYE